MTSAYAPGAVDAGDVRAASLEEARTVVEELADSLETFAADVASRAKLGGI